MITIHRFLVLFSALVLSLSAAPNNPPVAFAKIPGITTWTTKITAPKRFKLQFYTLDRGRETLIYEYGTGDSNLIETPCSIWMGRLEGTPHIRVETTSMQGLGSAESDLSLPPLAGCQLVPLPAKTQVGDYMLFGLKKEDAPVKRTVNPQDYARGIFLRIQPALPRQPEARPQIN